MDRCHQSQKKNHTKASKVCSDHFVSGRPAELFNQMSPDWVPSLLLTAEQRLQAEPSTVSPECSGSAKKIQRYQRAQKRKERKVHFPVAEAMLNLATEAVLNDEQEGTMPEEPEMPINIEADICDKEDCIRVRNEMQRLLTANLKLRDELQQFKVNPQLFETSEDRVKFYTDLPDFVTLMALFHLIEPAMPNVAKAALDPFQKFMVVMMRLRLNYAYQDLSYRFRVSKVIHRAFHQTLNIMYDHLSSLILWPDREDLQKTMPLEFRKYFGVKVAVIIDCFEIVCERPSNLDARYKTWSNYKHHNTVKFLIGIVPQGAICYLSNGWGGRVSDGHITENSSFLDNLLPVMYWPIEALI